MDISRELSWSRMEKVLKSKKSLTHDQNFHSLRNQRICNKVWFLRYFKYWKKPTTDNQWKQSHCIDFFCTNKNNHSTISSANAQSFCEENEKEKYKCVIIRLRHDAPFSLSCSFHIIYTLLTHFLFRFFFVRLTIYACRSLLSLPNNWFITLC